MKNFTIIVVMLVTLSIVSSANAGPLDWTFNKLGLVKQTELERSNARLEKTERELETTSSRLETVEVEIVGIKGVIVNMLTWMIRGLAVIGALFIVGYIISRFRPDRYFLTYIKTKQPPTE